ncbi:MAG: MarR family transcriptional regulator [Pseudomonadota bacterium]
MDEDTQATFFRLFNEIGIIDQISTAFLEARLPDGLIASHFGVVNHLIRVKDGRTPMELASAFQVPKTTMTHTLAGLEKHGFVEMRPNPDDGRSKRVWLMPAGRAFRDETIARLAPVFADLSKGMDTEALKAMLPALENLRIYLDEFRNHNR